MRIARMAAAASAAAVSIGLLFGAGGIAAAQEKTDGPITIYRTTEGSIVVDKSSDGSAAVDGSSDSASVVDGSSGDSAADGGSDAAPPSTSAEIEGDYLDGVPSLLSAMPGDVPADTGASARAGGFVIHDQKPRTVDLDYWAPADGYGTAVSVGHDRFTGDRDTRLLEASAVSAAAGEGVLHPDYHAGRGFSGDRDYEFVGWSQLYLSDSYPCVQEDGHVVTASDFTDPNPHDTWYWEPGMTYTPPTAGTLTSSDPNATEAYWWMQGDLYATYKPLIRYHANGGGGSMASTTDIVAANRFTAPSGKEFEGWNTKPDGTGSWYSVGQIAGRAYTTLGTLAAHDPAGTVGDETKEPYQPLLLYAQWDKGGGSSEAAKLIFNGVWFNTGVYAFNNDPWRVSPPAAMIDALERKFPGNYGLSMSGDLGYHDEVPFDVEHLPDMSRYQLIVAINANYEQLRPIPYLHDTLRGEWELIGWNTEPDGSGTMYAPGAKFHVPLGVTHLYAQFRPTSPDAVRKVHVTYEANGGTGGMDGHTVPIGENVTIKRNEFTRPGYRFVTWNTKPDGSGQEYEPGKTVQPTDDITLYAQWENAVVNLKFDANKGEGSHDPVKGIAYETIEVPDDVDESFTRDGYLLVGWNTQANGKGTTYHEGSQVQMADGDLTLYAVWTPAIVVMPPTGGEGWTIPTWSLWAAGGGVLAAFTAVIAYLALRRKNLLPRTDVLRRTVRTAAHRVRNGGRRA